jgi:GT2 family glycosyltransferase
MQNKVISEFEHTVLKQARLAPLSEAEQVEVSKLTVWVVVVTYNSSKWMPSCIAGIAAQKECTVNLAIVDNNSTDDTLALASRLGADCNVILLPQKENLGYGKASNIGIAAALEKGADYVLVLNPDITLFAHSLAEMILASRASLQLGPITPVHVNLERNRIEPFCLWFLREAGTRRLAVKDAGFASLSSHQLDYISGASMLFSAKALTLLGGFDEIFFFYGEDNDICRRYCDAGHPPMVAIRAHAFHWHQSQHALDSFRRSNQRRADYRLIAKKPTRPLLVGILGSMTKAVQDIFGSSHSLNERICIAGDFLAVLKEFKSIASSRSKDAYRISSLRKSSNEIP